MDLIVPKATVLKDLQKAFNLVCNGPVLLHSDILRIGMLDALQSKEAMCHAYEELLAEALGERTLLIPTFNYDFCRNGIYDVQHSPSRVGALTDHYRRRYWKERTRTPVFNFCIRHNRQFELAPAHNCFGIESTFAELVAQDGWVAFLGAHFSCTTFIHHVEELCNVPYRFHKTFDGVIVEGAQRTPVKLVYRVRPLEPPDAVVYDWDRLEHDLIERGLLHVYSVGRGQLRVYRAAAVAAYWYAAISGNPRFLLVHVHH